MDKIRVSTLDADIFQWFEISLSTLVISSRLNGMSHAVCGLTNLTSFEYVNRPGLFFGLSNTVVFDDWNSTCTKTHLTHLNLNCIELQAFPKISIFFPNLQFLSVSHNRIQFIENDAFDHASQLLNLDLSDNWFVRVPSAINRLSNLTWLNMCGNQIVSLEDTDLFGLVKLTTLILDNNHLVYVSANAFRNNPLEHIDFRRTELVHIPNALLALNNLSNNNYMLSVSFDESRIDCSCAQMSSLKSLKISFTFCGLCPRSLRHETIMDYIRKDFQHCP